MECKIHDVMGIGIKPEKATVEHMRNPRERMPVAGFEGAERPGDVLQRRSGNNVRIVRNVEFVVVAYEKRGACYGPICNNGNATDQHAGDYKS